MNKENHWYALYTRPRWEKKVSRLLEKRKIENFCPLNKVRRRWADRIKLVEEPLFSCYVFVRIPENEMARIYEVSGVYNFVHWLGKPAKIKNEEIAVLKNLLVDHENIALEKATVSVSDRVRIISGPLMAQEGSVIEAGTHRLRIYLPSLGYIIAADTRTVNIEIIRRHCDTEKIVTS